MQRKKTPEEIRRNELIRELIKIDGLKTVQDAQSFVKEILSNTVQNMLVGELDEELGYSKYDYRNKMTKNSRNGYSKKTVVSSAGDIELNIPRDRDGEFEPRLIAKNQTKLDDTIENRIISMYAKGMTVRDISDHINEAYGLSESMVSRITDKVLPLVREWQARPLESVYAIVFLDAIHYPVRQDGRIVKKAVYVALGLDLEGHKDILGMWVGENESSKYWLNVLNELKNRGVDDILIACTDNLSGFDEAIHAVYPKTDLQHCIIHQIRNSTKYVSYKDLKGLMADLKKVYTALTEPEAYANLEAFNDIWGKKYPKIFESWNRNWTNLTTYFQYPQEVRKIIYTTNQIENLNRAFRKVTKSKAAFPSDESLLKMLYLAMIDITAKWTGKRHDWTPIRLQLNIFYGDRMPE
jgi:putative transposase